MINQTIKLILQHCKQLDPTDDDGRALEIDQICSFIHNAELTHTCRIVAALLQSNEPMRYIKVKQISEPLGKSKEN